MFSSWVSMVVRFLTLRLPVTLTTSTDSTGYGMRQPGPGMVVRSYSPKRVTTPRSLASTM